MRDLISKMAARCQCPACCPGPRSIASTLLSAAFDYDTPKFVHVRNKKVGVFYRLLQLGVLAFIGVYILWYANGCYEIEAVQGTVTTKLKGVNRTSGEGIFENAGSLTWDEAEYVIPPQVPNSFFVMTNMWITRSQTDGECPESPTVAGANCTNNTDCPKGKVYRDGHGVTTGVCNTTEGTCMVSAWCPVEEENKTITLAGSKLGAENFTVLVKNTVQFARLAPGFTRRNIPDDDSFLKTCLFDPNSEVNKSCPIFTLKSIVDLIKGDSTFEDLAIQGAVVGLKINWYCRLSFNSCSFEYRATRLDYPDRTVSPGFNFRFGRYWYENGVQYRDLIKAYGILFRVETVGAGYLVSPKSIFISIGSGIAYMALATYVTDFFVLYLLHKRKLYQKHKYQRVKEDRDDGFLLVDDDGSVGPESDEVVNRRRGTSSDSLKEPLE